ncbi:MAG: hypothetical protein M3134_06200 [Actinomycetota bacterium]|nr:hypothetical protein [Actinomycetota bacterium]
MPATAAPVFDDLARELLIATPPTWHALDLDPERRAQVVANLVDEVAGGRDELAAIRHELRTTLRETIADAVDNGAFFVALMVDIARGVPVSASVVASLAPLGRDDDGKPLGDPESMADALAKGGGWRPEDVSIVDLAIGRATRVRRRAGMGLISEEGLEVDAESVQFFVPLEDTPGRMLALSFSTPTVAVADVFVELFDVIAGAARWADDRREGGSGG